MSNKKLNIKAHNNSGGEKYEIFANECVVTWNKLDIMESISWCGYFLKFPWPENHHSSGHGRYVILFSSKNGKYKSSYFVFDSDWRRQERKVMYIKLSDDYYHAAMRLIREYREKYPEEIVTKINVNRALKNNIKNHVE